MENLVGRNVKFIPHCIYRKETGRPVIEQVKPVNGRIVKVHHKHGWFMIRWYAGETIQHECFKLFEIGGAVTLLGKRC
jgi:hypothetical protein